MNTRKSTTPAVKLHWHCCKYALKARYAYSNVVAHKEFADVVSMCEDLCHRCSSGRQQRYLKRA